MVKVLLRICHKMDGDAGKSSPVILRFGKRRPNSFLEGFPCSNA